ncbi:MAG TPA: SWIM zinc finger family protein, partial [Nocardioides sp.]
MPLLEALTNDLIRETFDPQTIERGEAYAAQGRVGEPRVTEIGSSALRAAAEVRGTSPAPYRVTLNLDSRNGVVKATSSCSCPVHNNCKHGAALGLVLAGTRAAATPMGPSWETELRTLLGQLAEDNKPEDDLPALALEIDVHSPRSAVAGSPTVELRPMR